MDLQAIYKRSNSLLHIEENALRYSQGGYHPVNLGDTFKNGRYKIAHKLGHGGFSTVWVARDLDLGQWVSLKIIVADESEQSQELHILQALAQRANGSLSSHHIVHLLDFFSHAGPNGWHQCLVFELLGPTVDIIVNDAHEDGHRLDLEVALSISMQLLEAKLFVQESGYALGDPSPRNLCFASSCLSQLSEEKLLDVLGPPECDELIRVDGEPLNQGVPKALIRSTQWVGWPDEDEEGDDDIRVIDLGHAFSITDIPPSIPQPAGFQAPETIFANTVGPSMDQWRIGLVIYYLVFGALPFQYLTTVDLIDSMISFLGELPPEWEQTGHTLTQELRKTGHEPKSRLEELTLDPVLDERTKELLVVVMGLLRFLPKDRISASDALRLIREIYSSVTRA